MNTMQKNEETSITTIVALSIGFLLSSITIVAFISLCANKKIWALGLNEIGDSLAGFAGTLAFLWIIITVILQKEELSLQRNEVSGLRGATENQANSLQTTAKIQSKTYLLERQKEIEDYIRETNQNIGTNIVSFLQTHAKMPHAQEFFNNAHSATQFIVGFFLTRDIEVQTFTNITKEHIRKKFPWDAAIALEDHVTYLERVWESILPLREVAIETNNISEQIAWESRNHIRWQETHYPILKHFNRIVREIVSEGDIAPALNTAWTKATLEYEKENLEVHIFWNLKLAKT